MALPSLPRVPTAEFPCFDGTMERSDLLRPSRRARLPSPGDTTCCARRICSLRPRHRTAGQGFIIRAPLPDPSTWRRSGSPRFLGNPPVPLPCSPTPAGPTRQAIRRHRRGPRSDNDEGSRDIKAFEAQSHGFSTRCLRFVRRVAAFHARLASRCWPLYGTGLVTRRIPTRGFRIVSYISSSSPKLAWRNVSSFCQPPSAACRPVAVPDPVPVGRPSPPGRWTRLAGRS